MNQIVEYDGSSGFGRRLQTIDPNVQFRPVYDQGLAIPESIRPISIQVNINRDEGAAKDAGKEKRPFSLFRSKFAWLLVSLAVTLGVGYARTRSLCQGFKDSGKFYYGMDVNRCVNILIKDPLATVDAQLGKLGANY